MSRLRRYIHSVASGYIALGANAVYVLASVPLILSHMGEDGYGAWIVISQIAIYLVTVDSGLTPSASRLIVDVKDMRHNSDRYSSTIIACWLSQGVVAFLVAAVGMAVLPFSAAFFNIPPVMRSAYRIVAVWQVLLIFFLYLTKIFDQILTAHQRQYLSHYAQTVYFIIAYIVLYYSFKRGMELCSMVMANTVAWSIALLMKSYFCMRLRLMPRITFKDIMRPRCPDTFRELWTLGRDTFLTVLGARLIMMSQVLILSRSLGVAAAATWAIATKLFFFTGRLVWQLFDASIPAFSEMMVRQEHARLRVRYESLIRIIACYGALAAGTFLILNDPFVRLWTNGRVSWPRINDLLLAVWLFMLSVSHCHGVFVIATKQLRFMRYIYFLEGACFVLLASIVSERWGIPSLIICSIVCTAVFHNLYVHHRVAKFFKIPHRLVFIGWWRESILVLIPFCIIAALSTFVFDPGNGPLLQLVVMIPVIALTAVLLFFALVKPLIQTTKSNDIVSRNI